MVGMDKISSSETNHFLDYWMEENVIITIELDLLTSNIKKKFVMFWILFFPFLISLMKEKLTICLH
jgi:hypothetical protein